jgi:hypothetical protein
LETGLIVQIHNQNLYFLNQTWNSQFHFICETRTQTRTMILCFLKGKRVWNQQLINGEPRVNHWFHSGFERTRFNLELIFKSEIRFIFLKNWTQTKIPGFIGFAYQGKDIVFRFIIEYSSLRDFFRPLLGNNNRSILIQGFFERWYFGLCWNLRLVLELCYLEGFWFLFRGIFFQRLSFWHGEIFEFSSFFFCRKILFNVKWQKATVWHTPCFFILRNWNRKWDKSKK